MSDILSMTGYAVTQGQTPLGPVTVEVRCVNSRFLDLTLRICDELHTLDPLVRDAVRSHVRRGKLECRIGLKATDQNAASKTDTTALTHLRTLQNQILQTLPDAGKLSVMEILAYPGVVIGASIDEEKLQADVMAVVTKALDAFTATRAREGKALTDVLLGYCDTIDSVVQTLRPKLPQILASFKNRMQERLCAALQEPLAAASGLTKEDVNDRIQTELTLYALKMDVDEEMNRLLTHTAETRRTLKAGGPVGRKLDFLMQEMNREANTLGSKAASIEMTDASLTLKLTVEQMREQIQNLE